MAVYDLPSPGTVLTVCITFMPSFMKNGMFECSRRKASVTMSVPLGVTMISSFLRDSGLLGISPSTGIVVLSSMSCLERSLKSK